MLFWGSSSSVVVTDFPFAAMMMLMLRWLSIWTSSLPVEITPPRDAICWRGGNPEWSKRGRKRLVRAHGAVESWEKFDVPESRWPLAWEMVAAIACILSSMGELDAAVYVLMSFDLYSRPTESLWVRTEDILFPIRGTSFKSVSVRLNPYDRGVPPRWGSMMRCLP